MEYIIKIHLDLDCYFVSAERTRNPYFIGKPVVVSKSGDSEIFASNNTKGVLAPNTGAFNSIIAFNHEYKPYNPNNAKKRFIDEQGRIHGIVIAKSYEAKKYGIQTAMPLNEALYLCPSLIVVESDHLFYQTISHKLRIYLEGIIPAVEQYSIDEFFGDLTGYIADDKVFDFITKLQSDISKIFNLPVSIGAAPSKWTAKLLTDRHKPYGVKVLQSCEVAEYLKDVDIKEFAGVGKATEEKLRRYKVNTIGDVPKVKSYLFSLGKSGKELYARLLGEDNDIVNPYSYRKSIGISRNFKPVLDRNEIYRRATILARHLSFTVNILKLNPTNFYFKIKYEDSYKCKISFSKDALFTERNYINLAIQTIKELDKCKRSKIKHIAISVSGFANQQLDIKIANKNEPLKKTINLTTFDMFEVQKQTKFKSLDNSLGALRVKFGLDCIRWGCEIATKCS